MIHGIFTISFHPPPHGPPHDISQKKSSARAPITARRTLSGVYLVLPQGNASQLQKTIQRLRYDPFDELRTGSFSFKSKLKSETIHGEIVNILLVNDQAARC